MSVWAVSSFVTKALILELAQRNRCKAMTSFAWVNETAAALLGQPTTFTIPALADGLLFAARLFLLSSLVRGEGGYRAVVGIMVA